jgi:MFS family permease
LVKTIAKDLHGSAIDAFWIGTSYLLACAVFQPFIAALSDIFGRRELLLSSLLFFTIGSIVCSVAPSFAVLLAGRCVQGIGGGGIIVGAQIIFADIVPLRQRPKWFSLVLIAWAIGTVLGPLIGGVFVSFSPRETLTLKMSTNISCRPRKQLGDGPSGSTYLSVVLELLR